MADDSEEYEKLVQGIYQTLHDAEGTGTIDVRHDVRLDGKSGCKHQIDVYWKFEMVGETHRVAIECKNYKNPLEIGKVRDFFGVLYDIGNIKGILVTREGYDSGGIKFADYYNISLKEARVPDERDWNGRLKDISFSVTGFIPRVTNRQIVPDGDWLLANGKVQPGEKYVSFSLPVDWENQIIVYDDKGQRIADLFQMRQELPYEFREEQGLKHNYSFEAGYLDTAEFGRIKIRGIQFTYDVVSASVSTMIEGERIAKAILKDVKSGRIRLFDKDGNIH
jgi:hypothetical protein